MEADAIRYIGVECIPTSKGRGSTAGIKAAIGDPSIS